MRVEDVLSGKGPDVVHVDAGASVRDVVRLLRDRNLGAVVVSPDGRRIVGIVSERDVLRQLAAGTEFLDGPVAEVMTADVRCCAPDDTVDALMAVMTELRVRHLPVVDRHQQLCGLVSIGDLVKARISQLQFERDQLESYVSG
jgi:CBS domain-containing protein